MNAWSNFFVGILGAAAALTGLIFVGVSISLPRILSISKMSGRALESVMLLLGIVIISALCLVPGQSSLALGGEILGVGVVAWVFTFRLDLGMLKAAGSEYRRHYIRNMVFSQLSILPYLIAGVGTMAFGLGGIYWLVPGIALSFLKAVLDAWVLLVEIHR